MDTKVDRQDANAPEKSAAWWWTPARFGSQCTSCGEHVPKGAPVAYHHAKERTKRFSVCERCADAQGLDPQPSKAFLKMQRSTGRGGATNRVEQRSRCSGVRTVDVDSWKRELEAELGAALDAAMERDTAAA